MIDLKNKKVLITGATGGIGGSIAKKFLSLNSEVLGTGTNLSKLEKLKSEFADVTSTYIPMHNILRIDAVRKNSHVVVERLPDGVDHTLQQLFQKL